MVGGLLGAGLVSAVFKGAEKEVRVLSHVRFSVCNLCTLSV